MNTNPKTICWNAIVKNEAHIIERCMTSMVNELNYWVVVDTGSTDGTQDIIRTFMAQHGIPGELIERPWVNFSHNRSEALALAETKADYILFCDADMALNVLNPNWKHHLDADAYLVDQQALGGTLTYSNTRLVNGHLKGERRFRYWGATHEYCDSITPFLSKQEHLHSISMLDFADGGAKSDKYARDARLLQEQITQLETLKSASHAARKAAKHSGLLNHAPSLITRNTFYLAKTYRDSGAHEQAIATYQKRVSQGGWKEEVWFSLFEIARIKEYLAEPSETIINAYLTAYENRPSRAEALYHLAKYLRSQERYSLAYVYALTAFNTPMTPDLLFISNTVYTWNAADELAIAAYWTGRYQQSIDLCTQLLSNPAVPTDQHPRIQENIQYARDKLNEK